jgi:hypothetical protein
VWGVNENERPGGVLRLPPATDRYTANPQPHNQATQMKTPILGHLQNALWRYEKTTVVIRTV